uniref:Uncharacterized protein n=1 Tax=Siphoviridae sp. ct0106 TaxID=2825290 RepID=A0A8S5P4S6_9CAUD|nr:MAG TPA: hypothetical protein [Siphoviridae sp. ct0106]
MRLRFAPTVGPLVLGRRLGPWSSWVTRARTRRWFVG